MSGHPGTCTTVACPAAQRHARAKRRLDSVARAHLQRAGGGLAGLRNNAAAVVKAQRLADSITVVGTVMRSVVSVRLFVCTRRQAA